MQFGLALLPGRDLIVNSQKTKSFMSQVILAIHVRRSRKLFQGKQYIKPTGGIIVYIFQGKG